MIAYRPEIDGLRAVAVSAVVLFHAGVPWLGGGFVGVDVFFVISGYLIASILIAERQQGDFSFRRFYGRRARRILPLLITVCLVSLPFAQALMLPEDLKDFGASLAGAATFTLNLMAANNVGYFDRAAEAQPLLHIWSLAVEEQFYLILPLMMAALWRFGLKVTGLVVLLLLVAGVATAEVWLRKDAAEAFYLLQTRGWTILVGVLAAIWVALRPPPRADILALAGLAMVLAATAGFRPAMAFPGLWALVPTVGAALVILCAGPVTGRILGQRWLVGLGLVSYGLYLWHNPVMAFLRYGRAEPPGPWVMAGAVAVTLALAVATWHLVEQPFRRKGSLRHRRAIPLVIAGSAAMVAAGGAILAAKGLPGRFDATVLAILAAEDDRNPLRRECSSNGPRLIPPAEACIIGNPDRVVGVLAGDSHADALVVPLTRALEDAGLGLAVLTYSGCPLAPGIRQRGSADSQCDRYTAMVFDFLAARADLRLVILHARYPLYVDGQGFDNREGGVEELPPAAFESVAVPPGSEPEPARRAAVAAAYGEGVRRLLAMGKQVVVVTPVPEVGWHVPRHMAFAAIAAGGRPPEVSTAAERFRARAAPVLDVFAALPADPALAFVHPHALFCDRDLPGRCIASRDGIPLYADPDHLTNTAAAEVVAALAPYLRGP